jgi:hypothetical protein
MVSIKLSGKKRAALSKQHHGPTSFNQPEILKGDLLGEHLREKEEWVFIIERFAALKWKFLLLG